MNGYRKTTPSAAGFALWGVSSMAIVFLPGCGESGPATPQAKAPAVSAESEPAPTAADVLAQMKAAYAGAASYGDTARYVQQAVMMRTGIKQQLQVLGIRVAFERPNKMRLTVLHPMAGGEPLVGYDVACDGQRVLSTSPIVEGQVQVADAPEKLMAENFLPSETIRRDLLNAPLANVHAPLAMMFGNEGPLFPEEADAVLLEPSDLDGRKCHVVEMRSAEGARRLWIDQETHALRRMELPIDEQRKLSEAQGFVKDLRLWIDYRDAVLGEPIDAGRFAMQVPEGVQGVSHFVWPPPRPPLPQIGEPAGPFVFEGLDGEEFTPATLAGKAVLMTFWFTGCPPCRMEAPVLEEVWKQFEGNENVRLLAVSTDSEQISNEKVLHTRRAWGNNMPIARDLQQTAFRSLGVDATPTAVVLDTEGRVQVFDQGVHREAGPLVEQLQRVVDGEDLAKEATDRYLQEQETFEQELAKARVPL